MKENNITNIRILQPGVDGYMGNVAITCDIDGIGQEPRFLALGEYFAWNGAQGEEKQRIETSLADRYFNLLANRKQDLKIEDIHILQPGYQAGTGNAGIRCSINGIQQTPRPLTPMAYSSWMNTPKVERPTIERRLAENAYRIDIQRMLRSTPRPAPVVISTGTELHESQLKAILAQFGFRMDDRMVEQLRKSSKASVIYDKNQNPIRLYKPMSMVADGGNVKRMATGEDITEYNFFCLYQEMAKKMVSDIKLTDIDPETGTRTDQDYGYISCCINEVPQNPKLVPSDNYTTYKNGLLSEFALAAWTFREEIVATQSVQVIETETGYRTEDGKQVEYSGELSDEGFIYRDTEAFRKKEGICYMSEYDLKEYADDRKAGIHKPMAHYGVDYKDILNQAREMGFKEPEKMAEYAFKTASWQNIHSRLEDIIEICEDDELMSLDENIKKRMDWFVEDNGQLPNYAQVLIEYKEDEHIQGVTIALNEKAGAYADDEVMFTCRDAEGFIRLAAEDNGEDFRVIELTGYSLGDDPQKIAALPDILLDIDGKRVTAIERENDWNDDIYVVVHPENGTAHGFYVRPDNSIYDSTTGLNGQDFEEVVGVKLAQQIREMGEYHKINMQDGQVDALNIVRDVMVRQTGKEPYTSGQIRCTVNSERQMWKDLTLRDWREYRRLPTEQERTQMAVALADKYFADEINNSRQQQVSGGMKR